MGGTPASSPKAAACSTCSPQLGEWVPQSLNLQGLPHPEVEPLLGSVLVHQAHDSRECTVAATAAALASPGGTRVGATRLAPQRQKARQTHTGIRQPTSRTWRVAVGGGMHPPPPEAQLHPHPTGRGGVHPNRLAPQTAPFGARIFSRGHEGPPGGGGNACPQHPGFTSPLGSR